MPYTPKHKAKTRARIVQSALRLFVRHGFETVSIDAIMADAGLTRGGFYNHFATKEELYGEAMDSFGKAGPARRHIEAARESGADPEALAAAIVSAYLSREHLEGAEGHCPLMALPSDSARAGDGVKRAYRQLLENLIELVENGIAAEDRDRRSRTLAIVTLCAGGMALARAVDDAELSDEIRAAAKLAAFQLGGFDDHREERRPISIAHQAE